ncbi:MAG: sensor histidine kinase [Bacteroidales bacterium]|nr:sensor histidine kinase [Bacteroidales bacterium]
MKTTSLNKLNKTVILLSVFLFVICCLFIFVNLLPFNKILTFSISTPIFLFLTIFLINKINFYYLSNKIKPIYKIITESKEEEINFLKNKSNIIDKANKDVSEWVLNKTREIKKLKELEQYRKEFLGNVAHELKTPIFNIQGYILTLLEGGLEDESINKLYLKRTIKSVERMILIVEDLETISKLETNELKLNIQKFDIISLSEDIFESMQKKAINKNISLKLYKKNLKPIIVLADKNLIFQVLINLVDNAIKYGRKNGKVVIDFFDMDENIIVDVSDDGYGIEQKYLSRIFERFFRIEKSRSREMGGTGLGLSIVKHIIEAHNQSINVRSTPNIGSSFTFTLQKSI